MTAVVNQATEPLYQQLLEEFEEKVAQEQPAEPAFLQEARQYAFERFKRLGFPTVRVEDWKYTNIIPFLKDLYLHNGHLNVGAAGAKLDDNVLKTAAIAYMDCYQVLLLNGRLQQNNSQQQLPPFLKVLPMAEAVQEPAFQRYFGQSVDVDQYHFAALNTAFFSDGLFVEIAPNSHLDKPLHIVHSFAGEKNLLVQPRHLVVAHRSASLTIIESVVTDTTDAKILVNSLTEVVVEENAQLTQYTVQRAKKTLRHLQQTEVCQLRDSVYTNYTFSLPSAELLRNNLHVHLDEEHAESHLYGLYLTAGRQLVDNHTFMNHKVAHCESNEIYKGVLLDNSVGVFNGKVFVRQDAQKTNAFQQNNNLLLSPKATINSKPQLEIFADDVKCSHGSTTGQLNPEALFYLKTRGISDHTAKAMLVNAFAFDVTEKIKIPELEAYINRLISEYVPAEQEAVV